MSYEEALAQDVTLTIFGAVNDDPPHQLMQIVFSGQPTPEEYDKTMKEAFYALYVAMSKGSESDE